MTSMNYPNKKVRRVIRGKGARKAWWEYRGKVVEKEMLALLDLKEQTEEMEAGDRVEQSPSSLSEQTAKKSDGKLECYRAALSD